MITKSELKKALLYDADTGVFTWKIDVPPNVKSGMVAGCVNNVTKYKVMGFGGARYLQHRLAWLYVYGELPHGQIDHINGIRDDNRILNLRTVTAKENLKNQRMRKTNTSGFTGVFWDKINKKWRAQIQYNKKQINLGSFVMLTDAISARIKANVKYGFHKNHGLK